jgi:hypothetical protein
MSDELLKAATRALREETDDGDDGDDGKFTRARVIASLHQGKLKRRKRLAFIMPIAACLAAGTAFGAATGRLPAMLHAIGQVVSYGQRPAEPKQSALQPAASQKPVPVADDVPPPLADTAPTPPPVTAQAKPNGAKAELAVSAAKPAPATSSSAAFQDADGDLYRLAHEAHFDAHDYGRALTGWDAYLRSAPNGRFATEARYNRAICLLRLGRDAEARQALEPFASGKMGYRQTEARELLDELSR